MQYGSTSLSNEEHTIAALVALFLVPSFNSKVEGNDAYGLSPFVAYVFDYLIVPAVQKIHRMMDDNPKEWLKLQLAILPLVLLDLFILPGIIISCDEDDFTSESNSQINLPPEEAFSFRGDKVVAGESPMQLEENPTCSLTDDSTESDDCVLVELNDAPVTPPRRRTSLFPRTTPKFNSPSAKSKIASSAMRLRRISRGFAQNGTNSPERSVGNTRKKKRRNRQSLGDTLREIVTGSSDIRVRDHLFDLDLPSTPRTTPRRSPRTISPTKQPDLDAHITKRRSRRLKESSYGDN